ncbi:MAG: dTMP kinase [Candidatus Odinarchaeia archaeon]
MFIAFEGIDGSGTETWSKFSVKYLKDKGKQVQWFEFPDYKSPWGKIIKAFLNEELEMDVETQFLTYATDIYKDVKKIREASIDKVVITDRYIFSTMAYQCSKGMSEDKAFNFFKLFNFPVPNWVILLITTSEISMKRKFNEHGKLDRHERDKKFLEKVMDRYLTYAKNNYFNSKWITINTSVSLKETKLKIKEILDRIIQ